MEWPYVLVIIIGSLCGCDAQIPTLDGTTASQISPIDTTEKGRLPPSIGGQDTRGLSADVVDTRHVYGPVKPTASDNPVPQHENSKSGSTGMEDVMVHDPKNKVHVDHTATDNDPITTDREEDIGPIKIGDGERINPITPREGEGITPITTSGEGVNPIKTEEGEDVNVIITREEEDINPITIENGEDTNPITAHEDKEIKTDGGAKASGEDSPGLLESRFIFRTNMGRGKPDDMEKLLSAWTQSTVADDVDIPEQAMKAPDTPHPIDTEDSERHHSLIEQIASSIPDTVPNHHSIHAINGNVISGDYGHGRVPVDKDINGPVEPGSNTVDHMHEMAKSGPKTDNSRIVEYDINAYDEEPAPPFLDNILDRVIRRNKRPNPGLFDFKPCEMWAGPGYRKACCVGMWFPWPSCECYGYNSCISEDD